MAWQLRVGSIVPTGADGVQAQVVYYDDAILDGTNQPIIQYTAALSFAASSSPAEIQAKAIAVGQAVRRSFLLAQTLTAAAPPGTVIAIP